MVRCGHLWGQVGGRFRAERKTLLTTTLRCSQSRRGVGGRSESEVAEIVYDSWLAPLLTCEVSPIVESCCLPCLFVIVASSVVDLLLDLISPLTCFLLMFEM